MASPTLTFDEFRRGALARGFDEVLERRWAAGKVLDSHTHPFRVEALVVQGEMWLDGRHLLPGATFQVEANALHAERYGSEGCTFWAARRRA